MGSKFTPLVIIFSVIIISVIRVDSFNLSPHANQVFKIPADQRIFLEQTRSSYFGFAINLREDGILISAPRAQSTLEMQRKLNETGAIYKCSFGENPTCTPFVFDSLGDLDLNVGHSGGMYKNKKKEHQWLGMSMDGKSSPSDKFVVCAPRMITPTADHYLLHGMCYVSMEGTAGDKLTEMPIEIAPLRASKMQIHTIEGRQNLFYMYGEMGFNVHITENNEEILIGAPGVYFWKGTVVRYRPVDNTDPGGLNRRDSSKRGRNIDHSQIIEYETDVPQPHLWNQTDDSYLGFAVTSGYFGGPEGKLLYAASAPHASVQTVGEVYVFDIVDYDALQIGSKVIKKLAVLRGEQTGEFFGYTILAEDFNADGYTDLVVGAPLYSEDGYHEHGRVYYYQNLGHGLDFELKAELSGTIGDVNSRFGMSLGRIGDLDNDGYKDLAVGAPFENQGAVYIFSGGPDGIRSKAVQKIINESSASQSADGEDGDAAMFGMSISRGVDIDGNAYNDIAIGAPNAESVQLYKSYPVVKVVASITPDKKELAQNDSNVRVTVCIQLQPNVQKAGVSTNLRLKFKLDAQYGRAFFEDKTNVRTWDLVVSDAKHCEEYDLSISSRLDQIFFPLLLELHHQNVDVPTGPDFCESCVALNPSDGAFVSTKLVYRSHCASEKCQADLSVTSEAETNINPYVMGSSRIISMGYTVHNFGELAYLPQMRITKSRQLQFAKIPPNCQVEEESLLCEITRPFLSKEYPIITIIAFDTTNMDGSDVRISAEVFSSSDEVNPTDNIVVDVITVTEHSELESTGTSTPNLVSLDTAGETVNITHTIALRNDGPSTVSRLKIAIDLPMFHEAEFELTRQLIQFNRVVAKAKYNNRDISTYWKRNDTILIQNPTEQSFPPVIADQMDAIKYDNYKLGLPDGMEIQADPQQTEQLQQEQVFRRRRRSALEAGQGNSRTYNIYTQQVTDVEVSRRTVKYSYDDAISNRTITFDGSDCEVRHQCIELELFVSNFRPSRSADVVIEVTVEMDLREVAKLFNERRDTLLYRLGMRLTKDNDEAGVTIRHHSQMPYTTIVTTVPKTTPLWIYIVSVICGLLLITLITYGMYRCGFFRRQKREELARLTRQSKLEADETDDD